MVSREAVIVSGARTAIGTAFKGTLTEADAFVLGTEAVREAVRRSGLPPEAVDDVVLGESLYGGGAIGRYAAIEAGLVNAPGIAHNRHCASGLAALQTAAASVIAGMDRVVVAGGVQSSSTAPRTDRRVPGTDDWEEDWLAPSHRETPDAPIRDMTITVGWNTAVKAGISREEMDAWALRSHRRAVAGIDAGAFEEEIFPLEVTRRDGSRTTFAVDEHPRRTTSLERLASLKPLHPEIDGFGITAGDSAAVRAFASVPIAAVRDLGLDEDLVNVLGSGCGLGRPVAMTGARMVLTLTHELRRRGGVGVAAMCAGGGITSALVIGVPEAV